MNIPGDILLRALPFFFILIVVELIYLHHEHSPINRGKNVLADIGVAFGASVISFLSKGFLLLVYSLIYEYRIFDLPISSVWAWLICFFGDDLSWYWFHRLSHQVRFLWASHAVHHTPEVFSLSGGMRVPWTSNFTGNFIFWAWLPLVGIEPAMVMLMKAISVLYQFWLHTEAIRKMPAWFEIFFNTPSHHRVHHASDVDYLDKNHGGMLIIWDKMFGTFLQETHKATYGLTKKLQSTNPVTIAFHEWKNLSADLRKSAKLKDRLNYIFNSPGWSHDGSSKTVRQTRSPKKKTT